MERKIERGGTLGSQVPVLAVASSNAEHAADIRLWTMFPYGVDGWGDALGVRGVMVRLPLDPDWISIVFAFARPGVSAGSRGCSRNCAKYYIVTDIRD